MLHNSENKLYDYSNEELLNKERNQLWKLLEKEVEERNMTLILATLENIKLLEKIITK